MITMTEKPKIKIRDLNVSYKKKEEFIALKNINIDLPKNKITAIIGPSGCGKSTLLKSLNRLHDIRDNVVIRGKVYIDEEDIYHPNQPVPEIRRKIGLVAQKPYPLPASIYDNVAYGPRIHYSLAKEKLNEIVENSLKKAGLWNEVKDRLHSPAADLSVGQLQRLCIARTLAVNPEVILCDEITSALDPISSEKVENLLLSLKENYTIILVSHVLRQAKRLADYVVFLYLGEIIETAEKHQFFTTPSHEKSKEYIKGILI